MSVQEGNEYRWAPESISLLINSQAPYSGPKKITEIWNSPLIVTYIHQSVLWPTNLVFLGKKRNYVAINQTYVLLIRKTGFSVFLIKCVCHLEDMKYISWCGRDKPEKKSGLTFTLSISRFICFIVYIFIFSFWHYNGLLSNLVKYIYFYQRYLIFLFFFMTT